jgi:hypothetical protein
MINWHFWLATMGIVFYASSMWVAGITQGLMWREYGSDGYLVNSFIDTVAALHPMYILRMVGGLMYLTGALIMVWNIWMTILGKQRDEAPMGDLAYDDTGDDATGAGEVFGVAVDDEVWTLGWVFALERTDEEWGADGCVENNAYAVFMGFATEGGYVEYITVWVAGGFNVEIGFAAFCKAFALCFLDAL